MKRFPSRVTAANLPPAQDRNAPTCLGGCGTAMHSGRQVCPACWVQLPPHLATALRRYRKLDGVQRTSLALQLEAYCGRERARPR